MNALTPVNGGREVMAPPRRNEAIQVFDPVPILDTARFEQMQRVAAVMARTSLVPDTLRGVYEGQGQSRRLKLFDPDQIMANCFLVVNQAVRWGMDPFAVAQCCSVVHGRLMYEGKLVAAVLDAKLGTKLDYVFNDRQGDAFGVKVVGPKSPTGAERVAEGTVGQWKTSGNNSPWGSPANHRRQLIYRGAREWARLWEPAVLLGVYTPDEMEDLSDASRSVRARDVTPAAVSGPPRQIPKPAADPKPESAKAEPARDEPKPETAGDEVNLDELVAQVVGDAETASTEKDLDDCFDPAQPYLLSDAFSRQQRDQLEAAWEAARARIEAAAKQETSKPASVQQQQQQQPQREPERTVDPNDPDYQRGRADFANGVHKCLNPTIKSDPTRFGRWSMGYGDAKAEAE